MNIYNTLIFLIIMMLILTSFLYFFFIPPSNFRYNEIYRHLEQINFKKNFKNFLKLNMMMNLFSILDPASSPFLSMNWLSMFIFLFMLPYQFWFTPSRITYIWNLFINYMFNELKILINYSFSNITVLFSQVLILLIFFNNFLTLFPYFFTASSHMSFYLSFSFSLWMSLMLFSITNYLNNLLAHLGNPLGTHFMLMPFMVIIEFISLIIRPFTLAIRLTTNMIVGHLLLTLLDSSSVNIFNTTPNSYFHSNLTLYSWNLSVYNSNLCIINFIYFMQ